MSAWAAAGPPGRGAGVRETLARLRLSVPGHQLRQAQVGLVELPRGTGSRTSCPRRPLLLSAPSLLPKAVPEAELPIWLGEGRGEAGVQAPGHGPGGLSQAGARLAVRGQRSREAGAPSPQAFMRRPRPRFRALSSRSPYPPGPRPAGALRSHTSSHPCPGARRPLAHPWTAPRPPCPRPPRPPRPRRR